MDYKAEQPGNPDLIAKANEQQAKENLRRARVTAVVFGVITGLALITLVYGFVQKELADKQSIEVARKVKQIDSLKVQLQNCNKQLDMLNSINELSSKTAARLLQEAEEKLKQSKKK